LNFVACKTKFAIPYLLCIAGHCVGFFCYLAVFIENSLTLSTEDMVTGGKLASFFKAAHRNLENIGIDFLLVSPWLLSSVLKILSH
jgi:hypothetical protein